MVVVVVCRPCLVRGPAVTAARCPLPQVPDLSKLMKVVPGTGRAVRAYNGTAHRKLAAYYAFKGEPVGWAVCRLLSRWQSAWKSG